jgi:hypothetical protein
VSPEAGIDPKLIVDDMNKARDRSDALEAHLRAADRPDVTVLLPNAAARYRQKVIDIQVALTRGDLAPLEAVTLVRGMVHEIRAIPEPDGIMGLEVVGDLAAILAGEQGGNQRDFIDGCGGLQQPTKSHDIRDGWLFAKSSINASATWSNAGPVRNLTSLSLSKQPKSDGPPRLWRDT